MLKRRAGSKVFFKKLKEKSKIELYVATVDTTGDTGDFAFLATARARLEYRRKDQLAARVCCWLFQSRRRLRSLNSAAPRNRVARRRVG